MWVDLTPSWSIHVRLHIHVCAVSGLRTSWKYKSFSYHHKSGLDYSKPNASLMLSLFTKYTIWESTRGFMWGFSLATCGERSQNRRRKWAHDQADFKSRWPAICRAMQNGPVSLLESHHQCRSTMKCSQGSSGSDTRPTSCNTPVEILEFSPPV